MPQKNPKNLDCFARHRTLLAFVADRFAILPSRRPAPVEESV
ncbi:hypothetical protein ACFVYF_16520 [Streptomyces sp. NPDC058274]